jgi:dienelactone hydrolase
MALAGLFVLSLLLACAADRTTSAPSPGPALEAALAWPLVSARGATPLWQGEAVEREGIQARALLLALDEAATPLPIVMILLEPEGALEAGVLVAHGHYEGGKNDPNAWDVAWGLARRGARVVLVDSPGVEEWSSEPYDLHFERGAHNRVLLAAAGSSAMALQVATLRRGLDLLESRGARQLGATGASGGAVAAFYLGLVDPRVRALALASPPPIPREPEAGGCPCDQLPGLPGPDPTVLGALGLPTLWMSDQPGPRPEGLGRAVQLRQLPGPHAYTQAMQALAWDFFDEQLGLRRAAAEGEPPRLGLRSPGPRAGDGLGSLRTLSLPEGGPWQPRIDPDHPFPYELRCSGEGPAVLALGALPADLEALAEAGLSPCALRLPEDPRALARAIGAGQPPADAVLGAVQAATHKRPFRGLFARRGWALLAARAELPWVLVDPLTALERVDPQQDPPWIHLPGAWSGGAQAAAASALAQGSEPTALARQLRVALEGAP